MMNGDGERKSIVAELQTKLESKQSFESAAEDLTKLVREHYASAFPSDQVLYVPLDMIHLAEDIPLESSVTEELPNGVSEVPSEKPKVSGDSNGALSNGGTPGWTSADPPPDEHTGTSPPEGGPLPEVATPPEVASPPEAATPKSGVLGPAPPATSNVVEQPPQQIYTYYMVRIPRPQDNKGKAEITAAEQQLKDRTEARDLHNINVRLARNKRNEAYERWKAARQVEWECLQLVRAKFDEMRPLKDNLRKLKDAGWTVREKSRDLPTSEEDLDHRIACLEWRIQHESIPLKEEKQLLRHIKQLQASRETVRANVAHYMQVHESLGNRVDIEEALKPLNAEYKQLESELDAAAEKCGLAEAEYNRLDKAVSHVHELMQKANELRQEAYEALKLLKVQSNGLVREFYDNRREIQQAKLLASQSNNRKVVAEYCNAQVDRILESWNNNDEFRKKYIKDNERSTLKRLGTLDGRSLGVDEEPPLLSSYADPVPSTVPVSQTKSSSTENGPQAGRTIAGSEQAGGGKVKAPVSKNAKPVASVTGDQRPAATREAKEIPEVHAVEEEISREKLEREAAELKEKRRAAEMAKAKEALERKKRIAERAQAKALARVQKEAEKKEREREKRALKKAASSVTSAETPSPSDTAQVTESNESNSEIQEPVPVETKASSRQRKRGVTIAQKRAGKAAMANSARAPVLPTVQKVFGLPLQLLLAISSVAVVIVSILLFLFFRKNGGDLLGPGEYKDGLKFKTRPDATSQSYSEH